MIQLKIWVKKLGLGYNDAYTHFDFEKDIYPMFVKAIKKAIKKGQDIIIDCTNVKKSERKDRLEMIPNDYKKIAVVFNISPDELKRRLEKREKTTGKHIPDEAIEMMRKNYTPPSKEEGFDKIINL